MSLIFINYSVCLWYHISFLSIYYRSIKVNRQSCLIFPIIIWWTPTSFSLVLLRSFTLFLLKSGLLNSLLWSIAGPRPSPDKRPIVFYLMEVIPQYPHARNAGWNRISVVALFAEGAAARPRRITLCRPLQLYYM